MTQKEEIDEIKAVVNNLFIQLSIVSSENSMLKALVLGLVSEKMPEVSNNVYTNFVNRLEESLNESMDKIDEHLFKTSDQSLLIRRKFEITSMISSMKRDEHYINTDK